MKSPLETINLWPVIDKFSSVSSSARSFKWTQEYSWQLIVTKAPNVREAGAIIFIRPHQTISFFTFDLCTGMGPMPWTINSEIYPTWARSTGNSISTAVNWSFNLLVSMTFLTLTESITKYGVFDLSLLGGSALYSSKHMHTYKCFGLCVFFTPILYDEKKLMKIYLWLLFWLCIIVSIPCLVCLMYSAHHFSS